MKEWSIEEAEALLNSLKGVVSARVAARAGGEIEEVHLLTLGDVSPKQSVRNVESALLARFGMKIDHRKVSVAQTTEEEAAKEAKVFQHPGRLKREERMLFVSHQVKTERSHRVRIRVTVEWRGERYEGEASGADLARARLETTATAAVRAIEGAIASLLGENSGAYGGLVLAMWTPFSPQEIGCPLNRGNSTGVCMSRPARYSAVNSVR